MPEFITIRRTDPEAGFMAVKCEMSKSAATEAIDDNELAYHVIGSIVGATDVAPSGYEVCAGDATAADYGSTTWDDFVERNLTAGIVGPNYGAQIAHGEWGQVQIWGYRSNADVVATPVAGGVAHATAAGAVALTGSVSLGITFTQDVDQPGVCGVFLTASAVFLKMLGL